MTELCRLDAIDDPGARGFTLTEIDGDTLEIVLVRYHGEAQAYVNSCPHLRIPLEVMPDRFFDPDRRYLQCSTHGALFRPQDGFCISGPCQGRSLRRVPVVVIDGVVRLA